MRYIKYILFLTLFACQTSDDVERKEKKIHYYLRTAQSRLVQCLYPQALSAAKNALLLEPHSYEINNIIGIVYFSMKRYDLARTHFERTIQLEKAYTEAHVNLAQALIEQKKFAEALIYLKVAENDLTYTFPSKIHTRIGEVYYKQKKYNRAQRYLSAASQLPPKDCSPDYYLGRLYHDQKFYSKSTKHFRTFNSCYNKSKSKKVCHSKIDQYYFLAHSEFQLKQYKNAKKSVSIFIKKAKGQNAYLKQAQKLLKDILEI